MNIKSKSDNSISCIVKTASILESFTSDQPELSSAEVARKTGIPKTTARRILTTLITTGFLYRNPKTGKYMVGTKLYTLGSLYLSTTDIFTAAKPVIEALNNLTGETINVSILDRGNIIFIMKEESKRAFRLTTHIGSIVRAYGSAMGKALLSELTEAEIDSLYPEERLPPLTKNTIVTKKKLKLELEQVRQSGVAFDREGSYEGVEAVGSVIRNANGKVVAAMSIAVPIFRMNEATRQQLANSVRLGASLISYRLGYQDKTNPIHNIEELYSWWKQNKLDLAFQ